MKTVILGFIGLFVLSGCASIKNFVKTEMAKQERLSTEVRNKVYDKSVPELRKEVVAYFGSWRRVTSDEKLQEIKEDIDKGFVYKGKYYQKYEPGLMDFIGALSTADKDVIGDFFTQTNYHTLKDDHTGFTYVFDGMVFDAKYVEDAKTKLEVYSFDEVQRGPYELDVDFMALLTKYGSLFTIRRGPVLMDKSIQYAKRDTMTEIDVFKTVDPEGYDSLVKGL
ncbi:MAG: hypothetical protein KDD61_06705 [Bdellovibrionales bacterium]|nr:hypothetical protein [Bdellovibrionales bacterium]